MIYYGLLLYLLAMCTSYAAYRYGYAMGRRSIDTDFMYKYRRSIYAYRELHAKYLALLDKEL